MNSTWNAQFGELSDDVVKAIINTGWSHPIERHGEDEEVTNGISRSSTNTYIDLLDEPELKDLLWHYVRSHNKNFYNFDLTDLESPQFAVYNEGNHYQWHQDMYLNEIFPDMFHRKLSMTIQLSDGDDYEGGDFEIGDSSWAEYDKELFRQKGTIITFPSFMKHRVTPVTKGTRYSLVSWYLGNPHI